MFPLPLINKVCETENENCLEIYNQIYFAEVTIIETMRFLYNFLQGRTLAYFFYLKLMKSPSTQLDPRI